jgi:DNA-binding transcriptional LysR family regulator
MRGAEFAQLKAFAAIVGQASFARAAGQLGMSASALSQTIRALETRLGVRVLNRTTRSVAPTTIGQQLYDRIVPMMNEMDAAVADAVAASGQVAGSLRINAPTIAALSLIAPRLRRFAETYPAVELELHVDDGLSDIVSDRFDAGIRAGERLDQDVIAIQLTPETEMLAIASPEYLRRYGEPLVPADLYTHRCISWRFPGSGNIHRWEFEKRGRQIEISVRGTLICNHQEVVLQSALAGLGIAYTYDPRIEGWIKAGHLQRVLADWSTPFPKLFLYYSNKQHSQPALRAFIDCLLDRGAFATSPGRATRKTPRRVRTHDPLAE